MPFEFATAGRILFGAGRLKEAGTLAAALGTRTLLVTGARPDRANGLRDLLAGQGLHVTDVAIAREPTTDDLRRGMEAARAAGCDLVIGFGGGSPMDAAKAI